MMLKRSTTKSKPSAKARFVRAGLASLAAASAVAALATGCLDRKVVPAEPQTSNVFVSQIEQTSVDKIDLLFMVDNSASMADKQEILKNAVPVLVSRLISPICVDDSGKPTGGTDTNGVCPNGLGQPEFTPINDIHIGIVSSSLGAHGNTAGIYQKLLPCAPGSSGHPNDNAHMLGTVRDNFSVANSWNNQGFLAWDPHAIDTPPGTKTASALTSTFEDLISATGEDGCGYEAQLESWYRFLIDPEPPAKVTKVTPAGSTTAQTVRGSALAVGTDGKLMLTNGKPTCTGCDDTLLAQRAAFLRPDSLVAIVMLTDENDCSIRDDGVGWFVGADSPMPRSTAVCDTNPNDPCCRSCAQGESSPPKGCVALSADPVCKTVAAPAYATWLAKDDNANLRCFNQHQRFGFDLLYETQRYVDGLTNAKIPLQSQLEQGKTLLVTNPLYDSADSTKAPRSSSLVFLAGIVGVPWQDVADDASLTGPGLTYLTAKELSDKDRWTDLLGVPQGNPAGSKPVPPRDPFMTESIAERQGTNAIANATITPATSMNPMANAVNGHEQYIPLTPTASVTQTNYDLQYACTFKLTSPKPCTEMNRGACDCSTDAIGSTATTAIALANSPLCQPPGGGAPTTTQTYAKGYPGARELQVLKDFGSNAIVASICPKVTTAADPANPANDPNYGYNPAVAAIISRLKEALQGKCLPRPIGTDVDPTSPRYGQVQCTVIEAQKSACNCGLPGRSPADSNILSAVQGQLQALGKCGDGSDGGSACKDWCECQINQLTGDELKACQAGTPSSAGYCYVDAAAEITNPDAKMSIASQLAKCPATQQQLLHFVNDTATGTKTPTQGAVAFIACLGASVTPVSGTAGAGAM